MKKISIFLVFIILIQTVSEAFVTREIDVISEKIIPFNFSSSSEAIEENLSIKGFEEAKIVASYVDNGKINANISGNRIEIDLNGGEWRNDYKIVNKVGIIDLNDIKFEEVDERKAILSTDYDIDEIYEVSGDIQGAEILSNGDIEVSVKESAEGVLGYNQDKIVRSTTTVNVGENNLNRRVWSDDIVLPHKVIGNVIAKSGDTSAVQKIEVDENKIKVLFDKGVPKANETTVNSGYTYFWIDRTEEGKFKKYNPNSVYSTDINKITGLGEYIDKKDEDEVGFSVSNSNWKDYLGIEKDGIRYVYVINEDKGIPKEFEEDIVEGSVLEFEGQDLNCEKFSVKFSNADVSYIPEGKLYSMGQLVDNTEGWGEAVPNREWESNKTFFNEITGKLETYVKHFKFFYGPRLKKTFGGYYTYPYICTLEYEHYLPVKIYSGNIIYGYKANEKVEGYSYNGWVKIEYLEKKNINDYPPTAPFNVKYNSLTGDITWSSGSDDYTAQNDLKYEIQILDEEWKTIENRCFSELKVNYYLSDTAKIDVRIRTIDELNQLSEWSYASESEINLEGELLPYIVKPGENINIYANTKSFEKVQKVTAKSDELQMYLELQKLNETSASFYEMSYDVEADFRDSSTDVLVISNGMEAIGDKEKVDISKFVVRKEFDKGHINFSVVEDVKFSSNGTLIFSNINYNDIPLNMYSYNSKTWFISWYNTIYTKNKETGKQETFLSIEAGTKTVGNKSVIEPKYLVTINTFNYNENGIPTYEYINVDKSILSQPACITWNTDAAGVTTLYVFLGNTLIHTYKASWEEINRYVDNFDAVYMYKKMKKFTRASYGYTNPSKTEQAKWNKIAGSIAKNRDLRDFLWLGYRVRTNEYVENEYVEGYNANPKVRNNYRMFISNDSMSKKAIKKYMKILENVNISMTRDEDTVFGMDVIEYTSAFEENNVVVPKNIKSGNYEITLEATDAVGNIAECKLTLIVQEDVVEDKKEDFEDEKENKIIDDFFGRFFYRDGNGYLEELKQTEKNEETEGFICAGETIGFSLMTEGVDFVEVDIIGDESIKTLDSLTKKFLIDIPSQQGKDTSNVILEYLAFPRKIYPQYVDKNGLQVFKWFYTIPYGTVQSLESWSTLKDDVLEKIDISKLFDRRIEPYELVLYLNGNRERGIHLTFDVFERWDTVLNRDVSEAVINSEVRHEMRIDK